MPSQVTAQEQQKNKSIPPRSIASPSSKVFSVRLRADIATKVIQLAMARGLTPGGILNAMLDDYLNQAARTEFQVSLVSFVDLLAHRDEQMIETLSRLVRRLDDFEVLLKEATGSVGDGDV